MNNSSFQYKAFSMHLYAVIHIEEDMCLDVINDNTALYLHSSAFIYI